MTGASTHQVVHPNRFGYGPGEPTIHREGALRFVMWPNDHRPHVHAFTTNGEAVIELEPVSLREVHEGRDRDVARALEIVRDRRDDFLGRWRQMHE